MDMYDRKWLTTVLYNFSTKVQFDWCQWCYHDCPAKLCVYYNMFYWLYNNCQALLYYIDNIIILPGIIFDWLYNNIVRQSRVFTITYCIDYSLLQVLCILSRQLWQHHVSMLSFSSLYKASSCAYSSAYSVIVRWQQNWLWTNLFLFTAVALWSWMVVRVSFLIWKYPMQSI